MKNKNGVFKNFSFATFSLILISEISMAAQSCPGGPPPSNVGCVEFVANSQDGTGIGISSTKNFVYLEGMGGPTGNGKDWWGNMEKGEQTRTRTMASGCGISLPQQSDVWFSKKGIDCVIKKLNDPKLKGVKGAFEIDNLNWFFEGTHKKSPDFKSQADIYKYVAEKTKGSCFKIAAKNLNDEDLKGLESIPADQRSNVSITEQKGEPLGVKPRGSGWQNFNSPVTENYTLSCEGGAAGTAGGGGQQGGGKAKVATR